MAKGRFISRSVGHSREIAALPDHLTRMIFAFILPYLDVEGRIDADPVFLNGYCLSRLQIPQKELERALVAMHEVGLIELYEEEGLPFIQYMNFEKHQQGLRKDREDASTLPPPTGRFPAEFERHLKTRLYQPQPKTDICVGDDAARLERVPRGTLESPAQHSEESDGISLSLSSSSKEPKGSSEEDGKIVLIDPPKELSKNASNPKPKTTPPPSTSEDRLKNFSLIKAKLGPRRKTSPDDEDIDLVTECLSEDSSRDLWFDLPHERVQDAIRESTGAYRKGGQFKTELIAELDKATRTLRASVRPDTSTFDIPLVHEWEAETGETYQE